MQHPDRSQDIKIPKDRQMLCSDWNILILKDFNLQKKLQKKRLLLKYGQTEVD